MQEKLKFFLDKTCPYFLIVLILVFGFKFVFFPNIFGLDLSWIWAINYISATDIYTWGKDVFFTYGPLGYLLMPAPLGNNVFIAYFYYSIIFSVLTGALIFTAKNVKNSSLKAGLLLLLFVLTISNCEISSFLIVLLSVLFWYTNKSKQKAANYIFFSLATIFSIITLFAKINIGISSLLTVVFAFITVSVENKKISIKQLGLGSFYLILISVFMTKFYFHSFINLVNWLNVSLIIASGYTEAMVRIGRWANQFYLLSALVIIGFLFNIFVENFKNKREYANISIFLLPYLFFQFKSGFVRQDIHMLVFYQSVLLILALLLLFGEARKIITKRALSAILILSLIPLLIYNNFNLNQNLFASTKSILNKSLNNCDSPDGLLPENWILLLGSERVEILPFDFSSAVKYNLNIQFNPLIQIYPVYTKELDIISAKSYKSDSPKYIIINSFKSTDKRNMFFDNPATWTSIKENYKVVEHKEGKILLKQREAPVKTEFRQYKTEAYRFNEQITVPKDAKKAIIKTDLSLLGKITLFTFRLSPMAIYVADKNNKEWRYKQIRDVLENGLYTGSFATDIYQLNNWLEDIIPTQQIKSFRLQVRQPIFYSRKVKIEWLK